MDAMMEFSDNGANFLSDGRENEDLEDNDLEDNDLEDNDLEDNDCLAFRYR